MEKEYTEFRVFE